MNTTLHRSTVREVAKEAGVSKEAIARRMEHLPGFMNKHTIKDASDHNKILIDDAGVQQVLDYSTQRGPQHRTYNVNNGKQNHINAEQALLDEKDARIQDKENSIKMLKTNIRDLRTYYANAQKALSETRSASNTSRLSYQTNINRMARHYESQVNDLRQMAKLTGPVSHSADSKEKGGQAPKPSNSKSSDQHKGFFSKLFGL